MVKTWQLQEAKNKFSNLVERARHEGPQVVTKNGKETVVVLSCEDFKKLSQPKNSLHKFIQKSPLGEVNLDLPRDNKKPRDVEI